MIITDRFVFIHQPKCGGTFVTTVLKRIHGISNRGTWRKLLGRKYDRRFGPIVDSSPRTITHDGCRDIPAAHRDKPIVTTVRNPYDRYVSQFYFKWWVRNPKKLGRTPQQIRQRFADFPDISFAEFFELVNTPGVFRIPMAPEMKVTEHLGWQSLRFVYLYFKDPLAIYESIDEDYISQRRFEADMHPVRYLRVDRLNQDLHDFLIEMGYPPEATDPILKEKVIQPNHGTLRPDYRWENNYTDALKESVRKKESLIFAAFPDFDV